MNGEVTYTDSTGTEKSFRVDSVVIFGGLRGKREEALQYNGTARSAVYLIGDCTGRCGNVQKTTRSAYYMASQI